MSEPTMEQPKTDDIPENGHVRQKHVIITRTNERNMTVSQ
jgi:hypothetical protein